MKLRLDPGTVPGTVRARADMGGSTGMDFLDRVFYVSDGIMLAQIRDITGLDSSTLQNWVKRGWIGSTVNKKYSKDQLARIIIINMLRPSMQLEDIDGLLHYINGEIGNRDDDIIPESGLYDLVCGTLDAFSERGLETPGELRDVIREMTGQYRETEPGASERLRTGLEIIVLAWFAAEAAASANGLLREVRPRHAAKPKGGKE